VDYYSNRQVEIQVLRTRPWADRVLSKTILQAMRQRSQVAESARGILFLGVPHSGTAAAFVGLLMSCTSFWRCSSSVLFEYMAKDGGTRKQLLEDFHKDFATKPLPGYTLPYICDVYEDRPETKLGIVLGRVRYTPISSD
jgi:hypothetical protein